MDSGFLRRLNLESTWSWMTLMRSLHWGRMAVRLAVRPRSLIHCLAGAIPADNSSAAHPVVAVTLSSVGTAFPSAKRSLAPRNWICCDGTRADFSVLMISPREVTSWLTVWICRLRIPGYGAVISQSSR